MRLTFGALVALAIGWGLCAPSHAQYLFPIQQVPGGGGGTAQIDNQLFTGSQLTPDPFFDGTTLVGNLTGCSPCSFTGGADDAKFQIVTTGWHVGNVGEPGYRGPIELQTKGNLSPQTNGWDVQVNSTPIHIGPPAYNFQSTVTHVSPGTSVVQGAINSASAGTTLVLDAGSYTECGGWTMKANVDVVHPTDGNHATIDGCGRAEITGASNAEVYGLNLNNFGQQGPGKGVYLSFGLNGDSFLNNHLVMNSTAYGICQSGGNGLHVAWNTFENFGGNDVECGGGDQNYLNEHNALHNASYDMEGGGGSGVVGRKYIDNFADRPGQNCGGCGTGSYMESTYSGDILMAGNWESQAGGTGTGFPFASAIGVKGEITRNYMAGPANFIGIEWDVHIAEQPSFAMNNHDNYFDGSHLFYGCPGCGPTGNGFVGPYGFTNQPNSQIKNNNEIPSVTDTCVDAGPMPCLQVQYVAGTSIDLGVPAAPPAGSSQ